MDTHLLKGHELTRISQENWYLDIVSDKTEVLKIGDSIFILPYRKLFGIKQVMIPPYVQRIDPVSLNNHKTEIEFPIEIINRFPCGYLSVTKPFQKIPAFIHIQERINYTLQLNRSHEELVDNYHKGHKLNIKNAYKYGIAISESDDVEEFATFYNSYSHASIPSRYKNKKLISDLVSACTSRKAGKIYKAVNMESKPVAYTFITNYKGRLTYLLSCSNSEGKKLFAMHAILDAVIKEHAGSNAILDFEGSMIPGIAYFMKGFGAEEERYYVYEWNEHWMCKMKKKLRKLF